MVFKVVPPDYEVFSGGDRLAYTPRGDGLRVYSLAPGKVRVSLSAPGSAPTTVNLDVKAGMDKVEAKLEPRTGPLSLLAEAATGKAPRSVSFSADGKKLFVSLLGEPGVDVYDVPSLKKTGRLTPASGSGTASDTLAVGASIWTAGTDGRISAFDAKTLAFQDSTDLTGGGSSFLANLGDGKVAVTNWDTGGLLQIDAATKTVVGSLQLKGSLRDSTWTKGTGYASLFDPAQVVVIDQASWKVKAIWPVGQAPRPVAVVGSTVFVGDMANATVYLLDAATGKRTASVSVASIPHILSASPALSLVAVASRGKNNPTDYQLPGPEYGKVTLIDTKGNVVASVWGRNQPTGLGFSADGKYLAFTDYLDDNLELYRFTK